MPEIDDGISLATAQAKLSAWLDAEEKVARGQSVTIDGFTISRANAGLVTEKIDYWRTVVQRKRRGGITLRRATPYDG